MSASSVGAMDDGIVLIAPIAGWALSLDDVDDPVFRDRLLGDGIAIDPLEGILRAPADGEVIAVAPTAHSLTLRLENGAELLIHIGLETVALGGEGFQPRTQIGARVRAGDDLIAFDLEAVSRRAKSLVTPIVVLSPGYTLRLQAEDQAVASGAPVMRVEGGSASAQVPQQRGGTGELEAIVGMAHGLHARPAAKIVAALKPFGADVRLLADGREANARSVGSMLTLAAKCGERIQIRGAGPDAKAAVAAVHDLISSGMGEADAPSPAPTPRGSEASSGPKFQGVCASPGIAVGPVVHLRTTEPEVPADGSGIERERQSLRSGIEAMSEELKSGSPQGADELTLAHIAILEDPELAAAAFEQIDRGRSAAFAWRAATRWLADAIRATGDAFLIERVDDLVDVERRLVHKLVGAAAAQVQQVPDNALLIASNLLPSEFIAIESERLGGVVTARGGPTSHVAILAASAGVPMLVAAGDGVLTVPDGSLAVLDAAAGVFDAEPSHELLDEATRAAGTRATARARDQQAAQSDCFMADGTRIEVFANLGSLEDAKRAVAIGAEGCGLLRTEFLFLDRPDAPTEDEQKQVYAGIADALDGRPLIVRTLDIGGDKPVSYLDVVPEENPALGRRGVRLSLARPDILTTQLRAILAAVPAGQCRIMVPMIVDVDELRAVRALLREAAAGVGISEDIPLGVMIETPSAALLADSIAAEADFLSVGTNDLSQYALAVDRGNAAVAGMVDALHPAVLRLIANAAQGAAKHQRMLGVCGGLASEPGAAAILIGLGATELSAVPAAVPAVKAAVRDLTMDQCRRLAEQALALGTAKEVRALLSGDR